AGGLPAHPVALAHRGGVVVAAGQVAADDVVGDVRPLVGDVALEGQAGCEHVAVAPGVDAVTDLDDPARVPDHHPVVELGGAQQAAELGLPDGEPALDDGVVHVGEQAAAGGDVPGDPGGLQRGLRVHRGVVGLGHV